MVKNDVRLRPTAVEKHLQQGVRAAPVRDLFGNPPRTPKRWCQKHREYGLSGLRDRSRRPHRTPNWIHGNLVRRILGLRRRNPAREALRIHALLARRGIRVSWMTVHRVLTRLGLMVPVVRKPLPFKRFQRRLVDSLWQIDIHVHTILDDRSRFLGTAPAFLRERARKATNSLWWALTNGRSPTALYVDNGSCFISKGFRSYCVAHAVRVIHGRPYHPRGRGKLERLHRTLSQELVGRVHFRSLSHCRRKIRVYRGRSNLPRLHGGIRWKTPVEISLDPKRKSEGAVRR